MSMEDKGEDRKLRREIANSNERKRMQSINAGFETLKSLLPGHQQGERMSKAAILQQTVELVHSLQMELSRLGAALVHSRLIHSRDCTAASQCCMLQVAADVAEATKQPPASHALSVLIKCDADDDDAGSFVGGDGDSGRRRDSTDTDGNASSSFNVHHIKNNTSAAAPLIKCDDDGADDNRHHVSAVKRKIDKLDADDDDGDDEDDGKGSISSSLAMFTQNSKSSIRRRSSTAVVATSGAEGELLLPVSTTSLHLFDHLPPSDPMMNVAGAGRAANISLPVLSDAIRSDQTDDEDYIHRQNTLAGEHATAASVAVSGGGVAGTTRGPSNYSYLFDVEAMTAQVVELRRELDKERRARMRLEEECRRRKLDGPLCSECAKRVRNISVHNNNNNVVQSNTTTTTNNTGRASSSTVAEHSSASDEQQQHQSNDNKNSWLRFSTTATTTTTAANIDSGINSQQQNETMTTRADSMPHNNNIESLLQQQLRSQSTGVNHHISSLQQQPQILLSSAPGNFIAGTTTTEPLSATYPLQYFLAAQQQQQQQPIVPRMSSHIQFLNTAVANVSQQQRLQASTAIQLPPSWMQQTPASSSAGAGELYTSSPTLAAAPAMLMSPAIATVSAANVGSSGLPGGSFRPLQSIQPSIFRQQQQPFLLTDLPVSSSSTPVIRGTSSMNLSSAAVLAVALQQQQQQQQQLSNFNALADGHQQQQQPPMLAFSARQPDGSNTIFYLPANQQQQTAVTMPYSAGQHQQHSIMPGNNQQQKAIMNEQPSSSSSFYGPESGLMLASTTSNTAATVGSDDDVVVLDDNRQQQRHNLANFQFMLTTDAAGNTVLVPSSDVAGGDRQYYTGLPTIPSTQTMLLQYNGIEPVVMASSTADEAGGGLGTLLEAIHHIESGTTTDLTAPALFLQQQQQTRAEHQQKISDQPLSSSYASMMPNCINTPRKRIQAAHFYEQGLMTTTTTATTATPVSGAFSLSN